MARQEPAGQPLRAKRPLFGFGKKIQKFAETTLRVPHRVPLWSAETCEHPARPELLQREPEKLRFSTLNRGRRVPVGRSWLDISPAGDWPAVDPNLDTSAAIVELLGSHVAIVFVA